MSSQPFTYSALDSLAYLRNTVYEDLNAVVNDLDALAEDYPEVAHQLKELAYLLDEAACKIDAEVDSHRLQHVTHYSNGTPVVVDCLGPAVRLEDGTEHRGKKQHVNHPSVDSTPYIALQEDVIVIHSQDVRRIGE